MRMFNIMCNTIKYSNYSKTYIPTPIIDIYYFKWYPLLKTKIHNHASTGCIMFLLNGQLKEELYTKELNLIKENEYISPSISFINDKKGYHSIIPIKSSKSIHIYYPKGHNTKYYN